MGGAGAALRGIGPRRVLLTMIIVLVKQVLSSENANFERRGDNYLNVPALSRCMKL